jgi:hypothetical protein
MGHALAVLFAKEAAYFPDNNDVLRAAHFVQHRATGMSGKAHGISSQLQNIADKADLPRWVPMYSHPTPSRMAPSGRHLRAIQARNTVEDTARKGVNKLLERYSKMVSP